MDDQPGKPTNGAERHLASDIDGNSLARSAFRRGAKRASLPLGVAGRAQPVGGRSQLRVARSAFSYCSASDRRVHFGLGRAPTAESVTVRWPSGRTDRFPALPADRSYVVTEGEGIQPR